MGCGVNPWSGSYDPTGIAAKKAKQKQQCNKLNKDFKNGPHQNNLWKKKNVSTTFQDRPEVESPPETNAISKTMNFWKDPALLCEIMAPSWETFWPDQTRPGTILPYMQRPIHIKTTSLLGGKGLCVRGPQDHPHDRWFSRIHRTQNIGMLTAKIYRSQRTQSKISKRKGTGGEVQGKPGAASKSLSLVAWKHRHYYM